MIYKCLVCNHRFSIFDKKEVDRIIAGLGIVGKMLIDVCPNCKVPYKWERFDADGNLQVTSTSGSSQVWHGGGFTIPKGTNNE